MRDSLAYGRWGMYVLCLCAVACTFSRLRKNPDWRTKYAAALAYYAEGKYERSELLLEDIMPLIRGTKEGEKGEYTYAYSLYHGEKYILSAYFFKSFADTYGASEYLEDARYMHAYSLYLSTHDYKLDQSPTFEALNAMQTYIDLYPSHTRRDIAQTTIDTLQYALERRAFYSARLYARLGYYKAAIYALDNFQNTFPVSRYIAESWKLKIESQYALATRSIPEKKHRRYEKLLQMYEKFVDLYPRNPYVGALSLLYEEGLERVKELKI